MMHYAQKQAAVPVRASQFGRSQSQTRSRFEHLVHADIFQITLSAT